MKPHYVVGFLFVKLCGEERVVLISKTKPEWQKGRLNGVGGKIESGETPFEAMVREFQEETGEVRTTWKNFAAIHMDSCSLHFFRDFDETTTAHTTTDEEIFIIPVADLRTANILPNLNWLIPLAKTGERVFITGYEPKHP